MIRLVCTSGACPEQYDAFLGDKQVGYLRLRHGLLRVQCPNSNGEVVYIAYPEGDGVFDSSEERDYYLRFSVSYIEKWVRGEIKKPSPPQVEYTVEGTPTLDVIG